MKETRRHCTKCGASPGENPLTILHRFPKPGRTNSLRCELWAKFCFPHEQWSSPAFQNKLYDQHKMLCTKHFSKTYFVDAAGKKMFKCAVPDSECEKVFSNPDEVPGPSHAPTAQNSNQILCAEQPKQVTNMELESEVLAQPITTTLEPRDVMTAKNYIKCKKHLKKVYRLQQKIKKMKNKSFINEIWSNGSIKSVLRSKISPTAALILQGEMRNFKKTVKARRWDTDSKIVALRLYKRSPTGYRLLRRMKDRYMTKITTLF